MTSVFSGAPDPLQAGWDALRRGDGGSAKKVFGVLAAARPTDANVWYGLAMATRAMGEIDSHLSALDRSLALAPDHLPALLMKADHYAAIGDDRAAQAFYGAAVRAAPPLEQLSPEFREAVLRAQRESARYAGMFEARLRASLRAEGYRPGGSNHRIDQALDLMLGKREVFLQSPTALYFPELPQRQFYEREEFDWIQAREAKTPDIREELVEVLRDERGVEPYIRSEGNRPPRILGELADNPSWSAFYLIKGGSVVEEHAARCPRTMAALSEVPLSRAESRTPSVLFSLLRPRSRISAHNGQLNTRLICHLPLIVPGDGALRVGNETRPWVEGQVLIFDDSIEHEAWNDSDKLRGILLFEVWRPELTAEERRFVAAMLSSVGKLDEG